MGTLCLYVMSMRAHRMRKWWCYSPCWQMRYIKIHTLREILVYIQSLQLPPPPFLVLCSIVMSTYTVLQVDTVVGWNVISSLPWYARCTCARIRAINKRWRVIYVGNVLYWSSNCLSLSILIFLVLFYWYVYKRCATASISFVCIHYTSIHQAYCTECISWNFPPIPCWSLSNFAVICTQGRFEVSCITFIWGYRGVIIWAW